MADITQSNWSETDASNNQPAPDGAPEGMPPSGLNDVIRMVMGALKRFFSWSNVKTTGGTGTAYTLSYTVAPTALSDGMTHLVQFHATNGVPATLNVNSLGAKPIHYYTGGAWAAIPAGTITANMVCRVAYNQADGAYRLSSVPLAINATTKSAGDNTTAVATTAFVQAATAKVYVQTFTASGTYTPRTGMVTCLIECVGGGGGGGGVATTYNSINSGGGGGGAGGYSQKLATAADIGASKPVTIGAGGSAGPAGNNAGGSGGDTSVGSLCVAKGGSGGGGCPFAGSAAGGAGGVVGTGDVAAPGMPGTGLSSVSGNANWGVLTALGGSSQFGAAAPSLLAGNGAKSNGPAALGYGGGGGGGVTSGDAIGAAAGGAGSPGFVRITEFCNQ